MGDLVRIHQSDRPWPAEARERHWMEFGITYALGLGLFLQFALDRQDDEEELAASIFSPRSRELVRCTPASLSADTWGDRRLVVRAVDRARARVLVEFQDQRRVPAGNYSSA